MDFDAIQTIEQAGSVDLADRDGGLTWFVASTEALNRHGFVLKTAGIKLDNFNANPVFVWAHDAYGGMFNDTPQLENVLGRVEASRKRSGTLRVGVDWADDVNPRAAIAKAMVEKGMLNATSVGIQLDHNSVKMEKVQSQKEEVPVFYKSELLEVSLVAVPANPEAVRSALSFMDDLRKAVAPAAPPDLGADLVDWLDGAEGRLMLRRMEGNLTARR